MTNEYVNLLKDANKYFRQGLIDKAIEKYKEILSIRPDDLEIRRIVGDLLLRQKDIPGAVEQYEFMAEYYLKEEFTAKAISMYKRIINIDPTNNMMKYKLADVYVKNGMILESTSILKSIDNTPIKSKIFQREN